MQYPSPTPLVRRPALARALDPRRGAWAGRSARASLARWPAIHTRVLTLWVRQALRGAPPVFSREDSRASACVHIVEQSPLPITPTIAEYGVFSRLYKVARPLP